MREKSSVRVLLMNKQQAFLLMRVSDPTVSDPNAPWLKEGFWVTIGGGLEPGETPEVAAKREIAEETGLTDIEIGPIFGYGEQVLNWKGVPTLLKETFIAAYLNGTNDGLAADGWTNDERSSITGMRWWPIDALNHTAEITLPRSLPQLARHVANHRFPAQLLVVDLSAGAPPVQ